LSGRVGRRWRFGLLFIEVCGQSKKERENEEEEKKVGSWGTTTAKTDYEEVLAGRKKTPVANQGS
jgi:hypothetical protein